MSMGKTNKDRNISIVAKEGVKVHKEEDMLIMYNGAPVWSIRQEREL